MMHQPSATGRGEPSQPLSGRNAPSQPLAGPVSQPLAGPVSQPLAGPVSQPLAGPLPRPAGGAPSQRRLQLSEAVESRIKAVTARDRQRVWLVNTVVLAQALITLALIPAFIIPTISEPMLATLGAALVVYAATFILNRTPGKLSPAVYTLVIGGGLVTTAQIFLSATLTYSGTHTAQAALFFLPVIIEAGLFLTPELTLIVAAVSATLTASAILLALSLAGNSATELGGAYLVVVYALGLEALVGYMSWQLATFIYEKIEMSQTVEDLRFAQARLEALQRQMTEYRRQLQREAGQIQAAVSGMMSHEYDTRVEIEDGELAPLAASLNLLFERLRSTNELERKVQRMEAEVAPLVDIAGRLADAGAPAQPAGMVSETALFPVGVALTNAQTAQARRLAQLFQLASDVVDALRDNQRVLEGAAADSVAAQRQAGELVALADTLTRAAQHEAELITQARRLLAHLLPRELTDGEQSSEHDPLLNVPGAASATTGALDGLGLDIGLLSSGLTSEYNALPPTDAQAAGIAPMTMPIPALDSETGEREFTRFALTSDELPGELVDSWNLLRQLHTVVAQEQRQVTLLARDLGVLSRLVRKTDANVVWALQALDTAQKRAEQAQALSGGTGGDPVDDTASAHNPPASARRAPLPTRPLSQDTKLNDSGQLTPPDASNSVTPAPGSLRVQDLLNAAGDQAGGPQEGAPGQSGEEAR